MRLEQANILAKTFAVTVRTIQSWEAKGAPLADLSKMDAWIAEQRRRRGVSKHAKKATENVTETLANVEPTPVVTTAECEVVDSPSLDSTLARLETAEKIAYERYTQTGSRLEGVFWLDISEQLRRERLAAGQTQELNDADWRIVNDCLPFLAQLVYNLTKPKGFPRLFTFLFEGYDEPPEWQLKKLGKSKLEFQREAFAAKVLAHVEHILQNAFSNVATLVEGTTLEPHFRLYIENHTKES